MARRITRRQVIRAAAALPAALALNGCVLMSGRRDSTDVQPASGNVSVSFVSAEGTSTETLETGQAGELNVIVFVSAQQGILRVEMLDPQNAVVFAVQGRPDAPVTRSGTVPTDPSGIVRYRVFAQGARSGGYQLLYQRL